MAYKQVKKYGFRDSLEKGDPEKVIYGVDFDAEFEAIEQAFDGIFGEDGTVGPDDPSFADVVFQNRTEPQKVVSEFSFEQAGDSPLTMKNTGMYADTAYIRYTGVTWEVDPSLSVTGDLAVDGNIDATGNISMDGNLTVGGQVEGDLTVNGNIIIDGGSIVDPDGNDASLPAGEAKNTLLHDGDKWVANDRLQIDPANEYAAHLKPAVDEVGDPVLNQFSQQVTTFTAGGPISMQLGEYNAELYDGWFRTLHTGSIQGSDADLSIANQTQRGFRVLNNYLYPWTADYDIGDSSNPWGSAYFSGTVDAGFLSASAVHAISWNNPGDNIGLGLANNELYPVNGDNTATTNGVIDLGNAVRRYKNAYFSGSVNSGSFVKSGGTASQLLCADGSVVDKGSVGGSGPDLSAYYTKTESDARYKPISYTAPVASVNGKTGAVTLTAADVGASTYTGADAVKTAGNQTVGGIKTFTSDIRAKANVYAYYGSDERLKDDIAPMPVGLIDAIEPSTWKWKEDGRSSGGVIAQQLQKIGLDDWVREAPNGDLGVDYNALIGMLIAEVQDLKKKLSDG